MVRLMQEGEEGRLIRNALVEALWEDVDIKSKQLGVISKSYFYGEYELFQTS